MGLLKLSLSLQSMPHSFKTNFNFSFQHLFLLLLHLCSFGSRWAYPTRAWSLWLRARGGLFMDLSIYPYGGTSADLWKITTICHLYICRNNLNVLFCNFCKGINKLTLSLLVHCNVGKYSDLIVSQPGWQLSSYRTGSCAFHAGFARFPVEIFWGFLLGFRDFSV